MEDEFIATIKLITGEEIMSKVSYMPDDDSLVLENPMAVTMIDQQQKNVRVNGFALTEWIHSTFDNIFILPKQNILTMTEIEDKRLSSFYSTCVEKHNSQVTAFRDTFEPRKFTHNMGHLGSIKETRKSLEDLYKRS